MVEHSSSRGKPVLQGACPPEDNSGFGGVPSYNLGEYQGKLNFKDCDILDS